MINAMKKEKLTNYTGVKCSLLIALLKISQVLSSTKKNRTTDTLTYVEKTSLSHDFIFPSKNEASIFLLKT